jgi:hypothetical protein
MSKQANVVSSINSYQLCSLLQELDFSPERLQALKLFVRKVSDPENFSSVVMDNIYIQKVRLSLHQD